MSPALSVIIPSVSGGDYLDRCLDHLGSQSMAGRLEVIVVDRLGLAPAVGKPIEPILRRIAVEAATPLTRMWGAGIAASIAPYAALIEDHCYPPPDWASRLVEEIGRRRVIVGGSIANAATDKLWQWAAYFCEYGVLFHPDTMANGASALPLNNLGFPRELAQPLQELIASHPSEGRAYEALNRSAGTRTSPPASIEPAASTGPAVSRTWSCP